MYVDTHLHLNRREFAGETADVIARAVDAGVTRFLNVGYDLESSAASADLAAADPRFRAAVGVHPHDAATIADAAGGITPAGADVLAALEELSARPGVVAVGETGLDYYRDLSPRPAQAAALRAQLDLARRRDLPVVLHIRDAYAETLALIDEVGPPPRRGVLHAFAGDETTAAWAVERGFLLGIGGPVTYGRSRLPEVLLASCGPEHLLLETDAPWLPPSPHRGERNEPALLTLTATRVAEIYGLTPAEVAAITTDNFLRLIGEGREGS